jgi:hypothetical protein
MAKRTTTSLVLMTGADFDRMTDAEKDAFAAQFQRKIPLSETRPLSKALRQRLGRLPTRAEYERATGKHGRGRAGDTKKATRLNVTIDRGLLAQADAFAKARGLSRAEMIAWALRAVMARAG